MNDAKPWPRRERRSLVRVGCAFTLAYRAGSTTTYPAVLTEVGHGGVRLQTARAFIPGNFAMIVAPDTAHGIELKARVVWSRYEPAVRAFVTGLRVLHDDPDVGPRIAEWVYDALDRNGATASLFDEARDVPLAWSA